MKKPLASKTKLNLGCGYDHRAGYTNIDVDPATKPDVIHDLYNPLPYADGSVEVILLQDVLEHFTLQDGLKLLLECQRVLQKNGTLRLRVPSVAAITQKYQTQPDLWYLFLYGDTSANGVWGAHKAGYDPKVMGHILESTELSISNWQTQDTNFIFTLTKTGSQTIIYTVLGHQPAPILPKKLFKLENPRHNGTATHQLCTNWIEFLLTPLWRQQGLQIIWLVTATDPGFSSSIGQLLSKLLLRPLVPMVDRIFITEGDDRAVVTNLLRFSHLRTFQL